MSTCINSLLLLSMENVDNCVVIIRRFFDWVVSFNSVSVTQTTMRLKVESLRSLQSLNLFSVNFCNTTSFILYILHILRGKKRRRTPQIQGVSWVFNLKGIELRMIIKIVIGGCVVFCFDNRTLFILLKRDSIL